MSNLANKWSFRHTFNSTPSQPAPRLLDESVVVRDGSFNGHGTMAPVAHSLNGTFSPIATLPEELVQRVFLTYLDAIMRTSTTEDHIKYSHHRLHAPFVLSSVCRSWRAHGLASPLLWTYIAVPALVYTPSTPGHQITRHIRQHQIQLVKRWIKLVHLLLARSGQSELHIIIPKLHVLLMDPKLTKEFQLHLKVVSALIPHRGRVRTLCISPEGPPSSLVWHILGLRRGQADTAFVLDAPSLEHLEIKFANWDMWDLSPSDVHIEAPRLRTCVIWGATCLRLQQSCLVQLEVFTTAGTMMAWKQMLSSCATGLESLYLHIVHLDDDPDLTWPAFMQAGSKTIVFPRLTYFGVNTTECPPENLFVCFLAVFSAPNLRSLYFSATSDFPPTAPAFVHFIKYLGNTAKGTVKDLSIAYTTEHRSFDVVDARTIVQHLPSIEILTLSSRANIAAGFIGAMHHFAPHVQIRIERASVWLPVRFPQEELKVAVERLRHDDGTMTERRLAIFDVRQATRDYDHIDRTENISPDCSWVIQTVINVVVVWQDGPVASGTAGGEVDANHA